MLAAQHNACKICKAKKPWSRSDKFAVDHDHKSGLVRGLLCHNCNVGLGRFMDSTVLLQAAIGYLQT